MTPFMCAMTHSHVCHDSFTCVPWLIHMCTMTHSYVCHDSFTCVPWLIHVCLDSVTCAPWFIDSCHVTPQHVGCDWLQDPRRCSSKTHYSPESMQPPTHCQSSASSMSKETFLYQKRPARIQRGLYVGRGRLEDPRYYGAGLWVMGLPDST